MSKVRTLSFIGFGEAAQAFTAGFLKDNVASDLCAYDIKTDGPEAAAFTDLYTSKGIKGCLSSEDACKGADAIFSLVTAEEAERAACTAAEIELANSFFFDANSCAPDTKRRSGKVVEAAGGRYVDVAIMTPVHPKLHKSPCLIAGPHAEAAALKMGEIRINVQVAGPDIGDASTRKMIRSIMIKGLEALTLECLIAARKAGIEDEILHSLHTSYPGFGWPDKANYMLERVMSHGNRRAAEMREVVKTLHDLGVAADMTTGSVAWQSKVGALGLDAQEIGADNLAALSDAVIQAMDETERGQR